jgi:predicted nucleotidyltransferase
LSRLSIILTRSNIGETHPLRKGCSTSSDFDEHFMELELAQDFKELLKLFNENKVKYMLIGGYAVSIHGFVRATNDIDLVISSDPENAKNVMKALTEFGFGSAGVSAELFTQNKSVVRMGVEPVKIEILNYLEGPGFDAAYERRKVINVEDIKINVIGLEDLYANKAAVGRSQDLTDIKRLKERN